jgi:chloramphenicol O-acetyltransferase type A
MGKPIRIDMETYPRREHFEYFRGMRNPYVGVTADVDVTALLARTKDRNFPFFHTFLYLAAGAANSVPELRRRIDGDGIVELPCCPSSYTVGREDGTYCYCVLDTDKPFDEYLPYAAQQHELAREANSLDDGDSLPLFFISTLPWLDYTALLQPTPEPPDSNPRITWGKYRERDGKIIMPVSILCNHAIVDGLQLAEFYSALDRTLDDFTR